ncbi:MAG TPA: hypothetical protein VGU27_11430, partial [Candidatus Eisenbacteria bacterium]|nr:hypothetical protein [Candidatus Eisenbacteria bacterium]
RHELWGGRAFARDAVRRALIAGAEVRLPRGGSLAVAHVVYRTRRGERLYLAESGDDRLVLRALAGAGARTRLELRWPTPAGLARGVLAMTGGGASPAVTWTVAFSRRTRL